MLETLIANHEPVQMIFVWVIYRSSTICLDSGIRLCCCFRLFATSATYYMTTVNSSIARTSQYSRRCSLMLEMTQMAMEQYRYLQHTQKPTKKRSKLPGENIAA